jgi:hypothetical protein
MVLETLTDIVQVVPLAGDVPQPDPTMPPGGGKLQTLLNWGAWIAALVCIGGVLVAGGLMAISHHRGGGHEGVARLGWAMCGCIIVGAASALVGTLV